MSELLQNWLNNEVGLSTNITSFEKDFANGFLFGEILHKFRQQDDFDQFENRNTYEAKIKNFKKLEPTFKALGIKFNAAQANAMMGSERGASLRLLYQLKMAAERLVLASDGGAPPQERGMGKSAPPGGGVTKGIRIPVEQFDAHERRFFEHRLRATCLNVKQARLDKVTKKFEGEKHKQERVAMEMERAEQASIAEHRDIHRHSLLERMTQNRLAKDDWNQQGYEAWHQNNEVKQTREARETDFENRVQARELNGRDRTRGSAHATVQDGIKSLESNLQTLGLRNSSDDRLLGADSSSGDDSENGAERLLATTTQAANPRELVEALQGRMPSADGLEQEAALFLRKMKESKQAEGIARKERERRRRRVLVDLQREQDSLEESKLEEVLLEKLGRESAKEQQISYSQWRTEKYEDVIVQNRQLRQQEYTTRRKEDQQEALRRDQDLLQEMLETMREQEEREQVRYRAIERGRLAKRKATLSEEMEGILELISDMALSALQQEQLGDESEVDETLWREWMALFVDGISVDTPPRSSGSEGPKPDKSIQVMYPLTATLASADPAADISVGILDDAELKDYVAARGQWAADVSVAGAPGESGDNGAAEGYEGFNIAGEVRLAVEDEPVVPLSYVSNLYTEIDVLEACPVNYRLGVIAAGLLDRAHAQPPLPDPPLMPDVPLRLVVSGKPYTGKATLSQRLAESYNLQIVDLQETVRECLLLSKRPDKGSAQALDHMQVNHETVDDRCQKHEEDGNPYIRRLQEIGYELQRLLDNGDVIGDELYVHTIMTKIRSLFPDRIPGRSPAPGVPAIKDSSADGWKGAEFAPDLTLGMAPDVTADGEEAFEPSGWCVVGFPNNSEQLQLFERFLSGWVAPGSAPAPEAELKKAEAALLAPRPYEEQPPFELAPGGYDLHIRLDAPNGEIVRRAVGQRLDPVTSLRYHLEDSPPSLKGQVIYERLVPVDQLSNSQGILTKRIHEFDVWQPEVENLLSYFGPCADYPRLVRVDSGDTRDGAYDAAEEVVAMLLDRKRAQHAKRVAEQKAAAEEAAAQQELALRAESSALVSADAEPSDAGDDGGVPAAEAAGNGKDKKSDQGSRRASPDVGSQAGSKAPSPTPKPETPEAKRSSQGELLPSEEVVLFEPVAMTDLPGLVGKLEEQIFKILLHQWRELQDSFVEDVRRLFRWHRAHLADFRSGLHGVQQRLLQFVQRTDDKQALVDAFIMRFNSFSEEYPDMRRQDSTKEELHQQADDLHEELRDRVDVCRDANLQELDSIMESHWVDRQVEVVVVQTQHAVRLEASHYHAACQLITDFYWAAIGVGLPPAKERPPTIDVFSGEEPPKHRNYAPEVAATEDSPSVPGEWEFPFLEDLIAQARTAYWKTTEYAWPPVDEPKKDEGKPDPKAKAKGKTSPPPDKKKGGDPEPAPTGDESTPPLFVDMQQALLAERVRYAHRLFVIESWARRRLLHVSITSADAFVQLRDCVLLRRSKELDAVVGLIDKIKESVESEEMIFSHISLEGAHLHCHPNLRLKAPIPEIQPPSVENSVPYRWSIEQLDVLLDVIVGAARALRQDGRVLPSQSLLAVMGRLTQASGGEAGIKEQPCSPEYWRPCDLEKLQNLCGCFKYPSHAGAVDCVEFLLSVALVHSPLGWPSVEVLLKVKEALAPHVPPGCSWPDFWVDAEILMATPLFEDAGGKEAKLAEKFKPSSSLVPAPFDRSSEQFAWVMRVLQAFPAPLRQNQSWELEVAWHEYQLRGAADRELCERLLDDVALASPLSGGASPPLSPLSPDLPAKSGGSNNSFNTTPSDQATPRIAPRPPTPQGLPERPANAVSVRQLLTYLCASSTAEDGLRRAVAVLGPGGDEAVPVAELHAALLQLGARPTPPPQAGDGRPRLPSASHLCAELGLGSHLHGDPTITVADFLAHSSGARRLAEFGRQHCRPELERLFPKRAPKAAAPS